VHAKGLRQSGHFVGLYHLGDGGHPEFAAQCDQVLHKDGLLRALGQGLDVTAVDLDEVDFEKAQIV